MDATITLIGESFTKNDIGIAVATETKTEVFCSVRSVSRNDFYRAGEIGLALSYVFITNPVNYSGEQLLEYNGERYGIIRTYQPSLDRLELYAGYKVGVDNGLNSAGE